MKRLGCGREAHQGSVLWIQGTALADLVEQLRLWVSMRVVHRALACHRLPVLATCALTQACYGSLSPPALQDLPSAATNVQLLLPVGAAHFLAPPLHFRSLATMHPRNRSDTTTHCRGPQACSAADVDTGWTQAPNSLCPAFFGKL